MCSINALQRAIDKAGSQTALAAAIGKTQGHVSAWMRRNGAPADICPSIEAITGVRCEELQPDLVWVRDAKGRPTHYTIAVGPPPRATRRRAA
jgi:DNA-binding transcriptional regulator YdaS (Cro superfamily)